MRGTKDCCETGVFLLTPETAAVTCSLGRAGRRSQKDQKEQPVTSLMKRALFIDGLNSGPSLLFFYGNTVAPAFVRTQKCEGTEATVY